MQEILLVLFHHMLFLCKKKKDSTPVPYTRLYSPDCTHKALHTQQWQFVDSKLPGNESHTRGQTPTQILW